MGAAKELMQEQTLGFVGEKGLECCGLALIVGVLRLATLAQDDSLKQGTSETGHEVAIFAASFLTLPE
jgi:hypothetical protein